MSEAEAQVQEEAQAAAAATKGKSKGSGDLILDIAHEVQGLTKTKALNQADRLADDIDSNYFKLGGILRLIKKEQWFEGFPTFEAFVENKFGFAIRKAEYLMSIYTNLVDKQIPWQAVCGLGWAKLKDLAPILTQENLEEWVTKASACSVPELQALIKGAKGEAGGGSTTVDTSASVVKMKFSFHTDQAEHVQLALAKAKGELNTEHDNVAFAGIATGYLANATGVKQEIDLEALFSEIGYAKVLEVFDKVFPKIALQVDPTEHEEALAKADQP